MRNTLAQLCAALAVTSTKADKARPALRTDSRTVELGDIFIVLPLALADQNRGQAQSAEHLADALVHGAKTVVCPPSLIPTSPVAKGDINWIATDDARSALGRLAAALHGTGALSFPLIGITGTNGKTTSVYLLEHLYRSTGKPVGVLGTVSYRWPGHDEPAPLTTPDCLTIHQSLAAMRDAAPGTPENGGLGAAIMEVSSHAIDQNRVAGLSYAAVAFTNLTQDHLDYHGDMESYFQTKRRLFSDVPTADKVMVINADDAYGRRLLAEFPAAVGYGMETPPADAQAFLFGELLADTPDGLRLRLNWNDPAQGDHAEWDLTSPLVGRHNAANLMGVMALALKMGFSPADFACFHDFYGVSGRLERIPLSASSVWAERGKGVGIFVDYAHTPDALIRAQEALRDAGFGRVITVFGCGGDRDRTKRPIMGRAVAASSDVAVVTSDNPRTEDPEAIIDDIMPGLADAREVHRESDRRKALELAVSLLRPGDALLVAGKGHEPYQIIGKVKYPFSDQSILKELLSCA